MHRAVMNDAVMADVVTMQAVTMDGRGGCADGDAGQCDGDEGLQAGSDDAHVRFLGWLDPRCHNGRAVDPVHIIGSNLSRRDRAAVNAGEVVAETAVSGWCRVGDGPSAGGSARRAVRFAHDPGAAIQPYWSGTANEAFGRLTTTGQGLAADEALERIEGNTSRRLAPKKRTDREDDDGVGGVVQEERKNRGRDEQPYDRARELSEEQSERMGFIRAFMLTFGMLSSVFDFVTFGALTYLFHADADQFRTAWFMESIVSASLVLLVVRTRRSILRSKPSFRLVVATLVIVVVAVALPYVPFASLLGLTPLPWTYVAVMAAIVMLYIAPGELAKRAFYRRFGPRSSAVKQATTSPLGSFR